MCETSSTYIETGDTCTILLCRSVVSVLQTHCLERSEMFKSSNAQLAVNHVVTKVQVLF